MSLYRAMDSWIRALQWSPDGQMIAMGAGPLIFSLWNPWTGGKLQKWEHKFPEESVASAFVEVKAVEFVDSGRKVVFSHAEGSVEVYDLVENLKWHFSRAPRRNATETHAETGLFCYSSKRGLMMTCHPDTTVRA
jgi:WD40 repeat protein